MMAKTPVHFAGSTTSRSSRPDCPDASIELNFLHFERMARPKAASGNQKINKTVEDKQNKTASAQGQK